MFFNLWNIVCKEIFNFLTIFIWKELHRPGVYLPFNTNGKKEEEKTSHKVEVFQMQSYSFLGYPEDISYCILYANWR